MKYILYILTLLIFVSCTVTQQLKRNTHTAGISLAKPKVVERKRDTAIYRSNVSELDNGEYLVDTDVDENGNSIASVDIEAISVITTTKTVAERMGEITIDFMISVPTSLQDKNWGVYFTPNLNQDESIEELEKIVIRGEVFSEVQKRQYWQFDKYLNRYTDSSAYCSNSSALLAKYYEVRNSLSERKQKALDKVYKETVRFPYSTDSRLDSVILRGGKTFNYYYTQNIKTNARTKRLKLFFTGEIASIDNHTVQLPTSDTLEYIVTSMISLVDKSPMYLKKIIEKYATVNDKYMVVFPTGRAQVVDTLGDNQAELAKMERMFNSLLHNYEFFIDSIVLTATGSPDGARSLNLELAKGRGLAMQKYLSKRVGANIDTLVTLHPIAEDWEGLKSLIARDAELKKKSDILEIIASEKDLDRREQKIMRTYPKEYKYIKAHLYPSLRAVNFRYALRRVGMVQDTIHTTVLDTTYMRGVELLSQREYAQALTILDSYKNHNTAIALLSLGFDKQAFEILSALPSRSAQSDYILAIACTRLGKSEEGLRFFDMACEKDEIIKHRSNLDPEIQLLLKNAKRL